MKKSLILAFVLIAGLCINIHASQYPEPNVIYIPWRFSVRTQPDFRFQPVAYFSPQHVWVLCGRSYGWLLISTYRGPMYTFVSGDSFEIDSVRNIYRYRYDRVPDSIISPQTVTVLQQYGYWLYINTWLGPRWVSTRFNPDTSELDSLLRRWGRNISAYFMNIETGFVYTYNADRIFTSASVPKATLALYVYQKAERGETCLDGTIIYTRADIQSGSGVIQYRYRVGQALTRREVLRLNLSESDNIATMMLVRTHGLENYRRFVSSIGGNPNFVGSRVMNSLLTANEAGLHARAIFDYIESGGRYSQEFKDALRDNQFPFIVSDYPVASKSGWFPPYAWHDMAIVYAPSPYILILLSSGRRGTAQDYRDFAEISMAFQNFNSQWFPACICPTIATYN